MEVQKLVYDCAEFSIKVLDIWKENTSAGPDWLSGFLKRNTDLSVRWTEATNLARCNSLNKENVNQFINF